ncbi:MAG: hypothetical protein ABI354_01565 [Candidatus Saccharimonadales bacterium]
MSTLEQLQSLELSPEYTAFSQASLQSCMDVGAALLKGFLSPESQSNIKEGIPTTIDIFCRNVPEVGHLFDCLRTINPGISGVIDSVPQTPPIGEYADLVSSHIDTDIPRDTVMTLLLPASGPPAIFAANTTSFNISSDDLEFMQLYEPGDGMLLRQTVRRLNFEPVILQPIHHAGVSCGNRILAAVDIRIPQNSLNTKIRL